MNDLLQKIASETDAQLQQRRLNAERILREQPETPLAARAEALLPLIEAELERRHLPGMIASFLEKFPNGFRDELQAKQERDYKVAASKACQTLLARDRFSSLLESGALDTLTEDVKKLVQMTNLIQGSFEKPKFIDAISNRKFQETFLRALFDCLHGEGSAPERLGRFSDALAEIDLCKWTYASYFLFLFEPESCMFVKPEGMKRALETSQYPLEYDARPTAALYADILAFSRWLHSKLVVLEPRDMIDIQSFVWHMAPTGKWTD